MKYYATFTNKAVEVHLLCENTFKTDYTFKNPDQETITE